MTSTVQKHRHHERLGSSDERTPPSPLGFARLRNACGQIESAIGRHKEDLKGVGVVVDGKRL
eukprot:1243084-Rhodomonas_salina.1